MKKILTLTLVMVLSMGVGVSFAGGKAGCGKGKPLSKHPEKGTFQAASEHISKWGKSAQSAKQSSLRDNKSELMKRRGMKK